MKVIFVDAENVGLKVAEAINASIVDKVFVFSKNETIKVMCERKCFFINSSYPKGSNQADFYIIGHLVGVITSMTEQQKNAAKFVLYSYDNALIIAFSFQCKLHNVKFELYKKSIEDSTINSDGKIKNLDQSLELKMLALFKTEQKAETVRIKLKQPQSIFIIAFNNLIRTKKIKRVSKNKKTWIITEH